MSKIFVIVLEGATNGDFCLYFVHDLVKENFDGILSYYCSHLRHSAMK